jgi:hypothetical protein
LAISRRAGSGTIVGPGVRSRFLGIDFLSEEALVVSVGNTGPENHAILTDRRKSDDHDIRPQDEGVVWIECLGPI